MQKMVSDPKKLQSGREFTMRRDHLQLKGLEKAAVEDVVIDS